LVSRAVVTGRVSRGILISETGIDMCVVANKIKGVRAVRCVNWKDAKISREQNASNVICIGEDADVSLILESWLSSEFDAENYSHQIDQISQIERV
jgi:ribose 5-phosphate isomerase B